MATLKSGSIVLPEPVELSTADEIIWSSNTGRVADGSMVGDIVAEKTTLSIKWGVLTSAEVATISNVLTAGFHPITFQDDGVNITITQYRGTLQKEHIGYLTDGIYYYRSASVQLIQK